MSSETKKQNRAAEVGLVLGIVFIIMGLAYSNNALWILGGIVLAIGLTARLKGRSGGRSDGTDTT